MTPKDIKFSWIRAPKPYRVLYKVGILADGALHNPNGYPEDIVRSAVLEAIERQKKRRSDSAKKAAKTRAIRMEKLVYEVVQKLKLGHKYGPASHCILCKTALGDPESIERGIGSDCWQRVLKAMTEVQQAETGAESLQSKD
jgi:hypothetical protein